MKVVECGRVADEHKVADTLLISLFQPPESMITISQGGIDTVKCHNGTRFPLAFELSRDFPGFLSSARIGVDQSECALVPQISTGKRATLLRLSNGVAVAASAGKEAGEMRLSSTERGIELKRLATPLQSAVILMTRSNPVVNCGLEREGRMGSRLSNASKARAIVSPGNACRPVAVS